MGRRSAGQSAGSSRRHQTWGGAETEARPQPLLACQLDGLLCGHGHQQQKGGLFENEQCNQPEPPRVANGLPVGRQFKPGQSWRDESQQPAGGGEQKGKTDGKGDVGHGQHGREQTTEQPESPAVAVGQ